MTCLLDGVLHERRVNGGMEEEKEEDAEELGTAYAGNAAGIGDSGRNGADGSSSVAKVTRLVVLGMVSADSCL